MVLYCQGKMVLLNFKFGKERQNQFWQELIVWFPSPHSAFRAAEPFADFQSQLLYLK